MADVGDVSYMLQMCAHVYGRNREIVRDLEAEKSQKPSCESKGGLAN